MIACQILDAVRNPSRLEGMSDGEQSDSTIGLFLAIAYQAMMCLGSLRPYRSVLLCRESMQ